MPKDYSNIEWVKFRPVKIDYYPKKWEYQGQPLIVIMDGVGEDGLSHRLLLYNTFPRFWTEQHPNEVEMDYEDEQLITNVIQNGKNGKGKQLFEIQHKYPFDNNKLRKYFDIHYQADIPYHDAIRLFYNIKNIILIPKQSLKNGKLSTNQIKPYDGIDDLPHNDWILDIETWDEFGFADPKNPTGEVVCITMTKVSTGEIFHFTTTDIDKYSIFEMLEDSQWLLSNITHKYKDNSVPTSINRDIVNIFTCIGEKEMFWAFDKWFKERNDISIINGHNTEYDIGYLTQRPKWKNKLIKRRKK